MFSLRLGGAGSGAGAAGLLGDSAAARRRVASVLARSFVAVARLDRFGRARVGSLGRLATSTVVPPLPSLRQRERSDRALAGRAAGGDRVALQRVGAERASVVSASSSPVA